MCKIYICGLKLKVDMHKCAIQLEYYGINNNYHTELPKIFGVFNDFKNREMEIFISVPLNGSTDFEKLLKSVKFLWSCEYTIHKSIMSICQLWYANKSKPNHFVIARRRCH